MLAGIFSWITDLTDTLNDDWATKWSFLGIIFAIAFLDSVIPIVPSETTVIIGGVAAAQGGAPYPLALVIVVGAVGAFLGDNSAYSIGHRWSPSFERRAARKEKFRRKLDWARAQIRARGGLLLITARFIPGGRTALTLSSGITRQPRPWFMGWTAIAATIWASYAAGLGYVVSGAVGDNHALAFWVAFGTAMSINVLIELIRHFRKRGHVAEVTTSDASADTTS